MSLGPAKTIYCIYLLTTTPTSPATIQTSVKRRGTVQRQKKRRKIRGAFQSKPDVQDEQTQLSDGAHRWDSQDGCQSWRRKQCSSKLKVGWSTNGQCFLLLVGVDFRQKSSYLPKYRQPYSASIVWIFFRRRT